MILIIVALYALYWIFTHWGKKVITPAISPFDPLTVRERANSYKNQMDELRKSNKDAFDEQNTLRNKVANDLSRVGKQQAQQKAAQQKASSKPSAPQEKPSAPPEDHTLGKGALDSLKNFFDTAGKAIQDQTSKTLKDPLGQLYKEIIDPITGEKKVVPIEAVGSSSNVPFDIHIAGAYQATAIVTHYLEPYAKHKSYYDFLYG